MSLFAVGTQQNDEMKAKGESGLLMEPKGFICLPSAAPSLLLL